MSSSRRAPAGNGPLRLGSQGLALVLPSAPAAAAIAGFIRPPGGGPGVFAVGWRWLHGDVPYLEAGLEHKGPLSFAACVRRLALFGWHGRDPASGWIATTAGLGVSTTARMTGQIPSAFAGGYLLRERERPRRLLERGAERAFMQPFVVAAFIVATIAALGPRWSGPPLPRSARDGGWRRRPLGAATLGKPTALAMLVPILAAMPRLDWLLAGTVVAGALLPWAVTFVYFALHHAGIPFVEQVLLYNLAYGGEGVRSIPGVLGSFPAAFTRLLDPRLFALALPGAWWALRRWHDPVARCVLLWALFAFLEVLAQGRLWPYHFYPIMSPLAILWGIGQAMLGRTLFPPPRGATSSLARRLVAMALIGVGFSGLGGLDWREARFRYRHAIGDVTEEKFLAHFTPKPGKSDVDPVETFHAAAWARANLEPDQTLLVWGFEPAVNFLAERVLRRVTSTTTTSPETLPPACAPRPGASSGPIWEKIPRMGSPSCTTIGMSSSPSIRPPRSSAHPTSRPISSDTIARSVGSAISSSSAAWKAAD
jgi:hypothetical protein